jgi:hypothetical protein
MPSHFPLHRPGAVRRIALSLLAAVALAASPPAPGVAEAMAKVQAGDPAGAIVILK